ncbi:odorant receptor 2a-like [Bactrocera tryoni]|uniref:odorant receptor 2a-like n=1 Tax=Bactrocera tryoni TaxID=59916 RepID=UPI001A966026|nr:odorant receptor 2a-like [Bactrocera tryoni]
MTNQPHSATRLDSSDALRYIWLFWRITGIHPTEKYRCMYWLYSLLLNFTTTVLIISFYVVTFFISSDLIEILTNLSVMVPLIYSSTKHFVVAYHIRGELPKAALHLEALDRRVELEPTACANLKRLVQRCRKIYLVALAGIAVCLALYAVVGISRHKLPFEGWLPFDWEHSLSAYILACAFQLFCLSVQCICALCNDIYPIVYLLLLVAHLRILNARIARIGGVCMEQRNEVAIYQQLTACVRDHWECLKCISPAIAATIFIQFISTALALCTAAVAFVNADSIGEQLIKFLPYILVVLCESAPCCWLMDEAALEMFKLTNALFSCCWYEQNLPFRRSLIIFMERSQKIEQILAGNIAPISLLTFIKIIQFAFSLFTLLNQFKK